MITVYLDSQDYSVLSEENLKLDLAQIKALLLQMAASGEVRFVFSSVVVCEAAPTGEQAVNYAIKRGALISQLCQGNALVDPARLLEAEIRALAARNLTPREAVIGARDWFPMIEFDDPTPLSEAMLEQLKADPMYQAMTRPQRREAERRIFKKGGLRPEILRTIEAATGQVYIEAILAKVPVERSQAEVFGRYALCRATKEEATEAMRASIRDPAWLMRWFTENPALAIPIGDIVREPGKTLGTAMRSQVEWANNLKATEGFDDGKSMWEQMPFSKKAEWEDNANRLVLGVVERIGAHLPIQFDHPATLKDVARSCPGLDATARAMQSSIWDNLGGSRKELPSDSQFPDAMHAMYAPYVDIFRADSYMAPHIRNQVKRHGTQVVAKLRDLPAAINEFQRNKGTP